MESSVDKKRKARKPIRTVNVFTAGDSTDLSVWSNVPYLLCRTLERKGYTVNRIDYESLRSGIVRWLVLLGDFVYRRFDRKHGKGYFYAKVYYALVDRKIRRAARNWPADLDITPYNCGNPYAPQPTLLLGDWTQDYLYRVRLKRVPEGYQKYYAARQDAVIEGSDCVVSLFARCAEDMRMRYRNPHMYHLGRNVVNNLCPEPFDPGQVCLRKSASRRILFVGKRHYLPAARQLLRVFGRLRAACPGVELDIVGLTAKELGVPVPEGVRCHGYLNKGVPAERDAYYRLLLDAGVFVNTTQLWGGYSSTVEAMYFCNPVVISPYEDFTAEFGDKIPFGAYCTDGDDDRLCAILRSLFAGDGEHLRMCRAAHAAVADYTWDNFVDGLLRLAEEF